MNDDQMVWMFVALNGGLALWVIALVVISVRRLARRREELQAFAKHTRFTYEAKATLPEDLAKLPYFTQGLQWFGRKITNVMRRHQNGVEALVFDYWYRQTSGVALRTSRTTRATIVCLRRHAADTWTVFPAEGLDYYPTEILGDFVEQSHQKFKKTLI